MAVTRSYLSTVTIVVVLLGRMGLGLQTRRAGPAAANFRSFDEFTSSVAINQIAILRMMQKCSHVSGDIAESESKRQDEAAERDARLQEMEKAMENITAIVQNATQETAKGMTEIESKRQDEAAERDAKFQEMEKAIENLRAIVENVTQETVKGVASLREEMATKVASLEQEMSALACPEGWLRYESSCYLVDDTWRTWENSLEYCRGRGGDLAKITSAEEQTFIGGKLRGDSWIGLNDRATEGDFVWTDGFAPTYTQWWSPREPDNSNNEDCVVMWSEHNYSWHDGACTNLYRVVCERPVRAY